MSDRGILILTALSTEAAAIGGNVRVIGMGAIALRREEPTPRAVIMAGLGGGLDPALQTGDVVLDDPAGFVPATRGLIAGRVFTSDRLVGTRDAKRALFERTGHVCVDMEQAIVKRWADARGVPLVGVRAICDTAGEALDPDLLACVDPFGSPRLAGVASLLLHKPTAIADMLRLRRASAVALRALGRAVREIVTRVGP